MPISLTVLMFSESPSAGKRLAYMAWTPLFSIRFVSYIGSAFCGRSTITWSFFSTNSTAIAGTTACKRLQLQNRPDRDVALDFNVMTCDPESPSGFFRISNMDSIGGTDRRTIRKDVRTYEPQARAATVQTLPESCTDFEICNTMASTWNTDTLHPPPNHFVLMS